MHVQLIVLQVLRMHVVILRVNAHTVHTIHTCRCIQFSRYKYECDTMPSVSGSPPAQHVFLVLVVCCYCGGCLVRFGSVGWGFFPPFFYSSFFLSFFCLVVFYFRSTGWGERGTGGGWARAAVVRCSCWLLACFFFVLCVRWLLLFYLPKL